MERLTEWNSDHTHGQAGNVDCITRLCEIEDILGPKYDLGRLQELMEGDVEKVTRCKSCIHRVGAFCNHPDVCGIVRVTDAHFCGFGEEKQWKNA